MSGVGGRAGHHRSLVDGVVDVLHPIQLQLVEGDLTRRPRDIGAAVHVKAPELRAVEDGGD